jgi:hypothetical protein
MHSSKELYCLIFLVLSGMAGIVVLHSGHPAEYAWMPKCLFHVLTGLYCPGCGAMRSLHYLSHGQLAAAFRYQPLLVAMLPILLMLVSKRFYELLRNRNIALPFELPFYRLILLAFCAFFLLRNLPFACFACLRPPS